MGIVIELSKLRGSNIKVLGFTSCIDRKLNFNSVWGEKLDVRLLHRTDILSVKEGIEKLFPMV